MAKARAIVKRRKSVQNIRKITRTMELIATARFKKALDRATEAEAYTRKIAELVADLGSTSLEVSHPLLAKREPVKKSLLLVITSNRGLAGGYNGNVLRQAARQVQDFETDGIADVLEVAGKARHRIPASSGASASMPRTRSSRTGHSSHEVEALANKYIGLYVPGRDRPGRRRLHQVHQRPRKQEAVVETLLPMTASQVGETRPVGPRQSHRLARRATEAPVEQGAASGCLTSSSPIRAQHPGRNRPGLVQGPAVRAFPRRRRLRTDLPDGRHASATENAGRHDQEH